MGFFTSFPLTTYADTARLNLSADDGFTLTTARAMAWAAQAAYEVPDRGKLNAILGGWGWHVRHIFDEPAPGGWPRTGAKGFVAQAGEVAVVSISGTEPNSFGNWAQNFDFPVDDAGAHRGFRDGAIAAVGAVSAQIGPSAFYLTGHSLGGAIAAMASLMLPTPPVGIYTFGMPRPGNVAYRDAYNPRLGDRTYRFVYGDDLVPKVPPSAFGFRHVGQILQCQRGARFSGRPVMPPEEAASLPELRDIALSPFGKNDAPAAPRQSRIAALAVSRLSPPIRDHLMDRYLQALTPPGVAGPQSMEMKETR